MQLGRFGFHDYAFFCVAFDYLDFGLTMFPLPYMGIEFLIAYCQIKQYLG